ncbi:MAG: 23S rRNA (guanosine(2251)-2'-O)-methyltransferase RlmB [Nitrospirae bacterium]|nr:23S rRNA (guanosine(2251)-2'-O)-methyltransferase RlmB [Nitrospirota bacterium]
MAFKVGGGRGSAGKGGGRSGGQSQGPRQPASRREGGAGASRPSSGPGFKTSGPRKPSGPKTGGKSYGPPKSGQSAGGGYDRKPGQGTGDRREAPGGRDAARPQWRDIPEFKGTRGGFVDKSPAKGPGRDTGGFNKAPGKGYSSEYADLREAPKGRSAGRDDDTGGAGRGFGKGPDRGPSGPGRGYSDRGPAGPGRAESGRAYGKPAGQGFSRDSRDDRRDAPKGRTAGGDTRGGYDKGPGAGGGKSYARRPNEGFERGKEPYRRPSAPARPARPTEPERDAYAMPEGPDDKVMGVNPVLEMLRSGARAVDTVYIDKDKGGPQFAQMITLARQAGITVKVVPREALDKLSLGFRHQGAIASVAPKAYADADDIVASSLKKDRPALIVVLDGVEDPQNLGSIIRTAETAGADGVIIPEHRAAHLTASVARASAGALEHMPVAKVTSLTGFLGALKEKGFWVVGFEAGTGTDYTSFGMDVPLAVVLGSEGGGVRPGVKKVCDALVSLPVLGKISSLNVSVTAGIVLFEALRQRAAKK